MRLVHRPAIDAISEKRTIPLEVGSNWTIFGAKSYPTDVSIFTVLFV